MSQSNKKKMIFVIIFGVVMAAITAGLIYYQTTLKNRNQETTYLATTKQSEEKSLPGIDLENDKVLDNALVIENKEWEKRDDVRYVKISGLKDKTIEDNINKEILNYAENFVKKYPKKKEQRSLDIFVTGNYANVLSIEVVIWNDDDYEFYGLNYNLVNGKKIKFNELFTSTNGGLKFLREGLYEPLARKYGASAPEIEGGDRDISKIDYSKIEDDMYKILFDYKSDKINNFFFDFKRIFIITEDDVLDIEMEPYAKYISICNRYADTNPSKIYENPKLAGSKHYVLTEKNLDNIYDIVEETDNYYISLYASVNGDIPSNLEEKIKKMVDEIAKEKPNPKGDDFYVVSYNVNLSKNEEDKNYTLSRYSTRRKTTKKTWNEKVKKEFLEAWRSTGEPVFCLSTNYSEDLENYEPEETIYETIDKDGNDVKISKIRAIEIATQYTDIVINLEDNFELGKKKNGKNEITSYYMDNSLGAFTEKGLAVYLKNAKDYIEKNEYKDKDGARMIEYYLKQKDQYQLGKTYLYFSYMEPKIEDRTSYSITATIEILYYKNNQLKEEYNNTSNEAYDEKYFDKYNLKLNLIRTNDSEWKINNYEITK